MDCFVIKYSNHNLFILLAFRVACMKQFSDSAVQKISYGPMLLFFLHTGFI